MNTRRFVLLGALLLALSGGWAVFGPRTLPVNPSVPAQTGPGASVVVTVPPVGKSSETAPAPAAPGPAPSRGNPAVAPSGPVSAPLAPEKAPAPAPARTAAAAAPLSGPVPTTPHRPAPVAAATIAAWEAAAAPPSPSRPRRVSAADRAAYREAVLLDVFPEYNPAQAAGPALSSLGRALSRWQTRPEAARARAGARVALLNAEAALERTQRGPPRGWTTIRSAVERALRRTDRALAPPLFSTTLPALTAVRAPASPAVRPRALETPVAAAAPAVDDAELVAADAPPTEADLAPTVADARAAASLDSVVAAHGRDPLRLFALVHDRVFPEVYRGSRAGPARTLDRGQGNDLDTAWLLMELLRRAGVPARLSLDRLRLTPAMAMALTDTRDAAMAARVLRSAGIEATAHAPAPGRPVAAVDVLHWQARAFLATENAPGFSEPRWVFLAPLLKPVTRTENGAEAFAHAPLTPEILFGATSPVARWQGERGLPEPTLRTIAGWRSPFLPQAPAAPRLEALGTTRRVPAGERFRLSIALGGVLRAEYDVAALDGRALEITSEPAGPADAALLAEHGHLGDAPAVDLRLALALRLDGVELDRLAGGPAGDPVALSVTVTTPAFGREAHDFPLTRGGRYHLALAAGAPASSSASLAPPGAASPLVALGARYFAEVDRAATRVFDAYGLGAFTDVHLGIVGFEPVIERVAGLAVRVRPQFLLFDVPRIVVTPYGRAGQAPPADAGMHLAGELDALGIHEGPLPPHVEAMRLLGAESSFLEAAVPAERWAGQGLSAQQVLARATETGVRVFEETDVILRHRLLSGQIQAPPELVRALHAAAYAEEVVRVPEGPVAMPGASLLPPLTGFASYDPRTGAGQYLLGTGFHGGLYDITLDSMTGDVDPVLHADAVTPVHDLDATTGAGGRLKLTLKAPETARCVPRAEVDARGLALPPGPDAGVQSGFCVYEIERTGPDGTPALTAKVGAPCLAPPQPDPAVDALCRARLGERYGISVFLDDVPVFHATVNFADAFERGTAAWLDLLRPTPDAPARIEPPGMLGHLENFTFDDPQRRRFMGLDYVLRPDPRLPLVGRLTLVVQPQDASAAPITCESAQRRTGTYRLVADASTADAPGRRDVTPGLDPVAGALAATLSTVGLDFAVPTPGGPLGFDVTARGDFDDHKAPLGTRLRHAWDARAVTDDAGGVALLFGDGRGVVFRESRTCRAPRADGSCPSPDDPPQRILRPVRPSERGRLRRLTFLQPPIEGANARIDDNGDGCTGEATGYEYFAADGTRFVFARAMSRQTPDRREAEPADADVAYLSSVRDPRGNGFDLVYADDPGGAGLALVEVRAMSAGDRPSGSALRFEYENQTVELPGDRDTIALRRLIRVEMRLAPEPPEALLPEEYPPCAAAEVPPISDDWPSIGHVDLGYDAGRLTAVRATRLDAANAPETRAWQFEWANGTDLWRLTMPGGGALTATMRPPPLGERFVPACALVDDAALPNPFCGRSPEARPVRDLPVRPRPAVQRLDRPDGTFLAITPRLPAAPAETTCRNGLPAVPAHRVVETHDSRTGVVVDTYDDRGRLAERRRGARGERFQWLAEFDEPARHEVESGPGAFSTLSQTVVCRRPVPGDAAPAPPICTAALARMAPTEGLVVVRRRFGLPDEAPPERASPEAPGGETWTYLERVGTYPSGLEMPGAAGAGHAERRTRLFALAAGPGTVDALERRRFGYESPFSGFVARVEGPGFDFTALSGLDPATGLLTDVSTPDGTRTRTLNPRTGQPLSEHWPSGRVATRAYDPWGRLIEAVTESGGRRRWDYAAVPTGGFTLTETVQSAQGAERRTTSLTDGLDRLRHRARGDESITWNYAGGRLTSEVRRLRDASEAGCALELRREARLFRYDALTGRLTTELDEADGRQRTLTYDDRGRVVRVEAGFQGSPEPPLVTTLAYDVLDRVVATTLDGGPPEARRYDAAGHLAEVGTDPAAGLVETTRTDVLGRVVATRPPRLGETTYAYDDGDRLVERRAPGGEVERLSYPEGSGSRRASVRVVERDGVELLREVLASDADARPVSRVRTLHAGDATLDLTEAWAYPAADQTVHTAGPPAGAASDKVVTIRTDDGFGRVAVEQRGELVRRLTYDADGRLVAEQAEPLAPETTTYDLAGRVVEVRSRDGLHTTFRRAGETVERQTICEGSPLRPSHTTRVTDARGRLRLTCAPAPPGARPSAPPPGFTGACTTTTYGVDAARGLETDVTVDPVGHAVTRFVDAAGELRAVQDAVRGDLTVDVAPPDATGAVERITRDPEGGLTTEVSDAAGRLTARRVAHAPGLDEVYADQGATRVTTLGTGVGTRVETAVVDLDGRLHRHEVRSGAGAAAVTTLAYDAVGREVARTDPDGVREQRSYDASGRLAAEQRGADETTLTYAPGTALLTTRETPGGGRTAWDPSLDTGRPRSVTRQGVETSLGWDTRGRLATETTGRLTRSWTFDADTLARFTDPTGTADFGYDAAGRVVTFGGPGGFRHHLTYDAAGRPETQAMSPVEADALSLTPDALDRLTAERDPAGNRATHTYDPQSHALWHRTDHTGAATGLARVEVLARDALGRPERWRETRADGAVTEVEHLRDEALRRETHRRGGRTVHVSTLTPGGRLAALALGDETDDVVVEARDARGRPTRVTHGAVTVTLGWAPDDQPRFTHVGPPYDVQACMFYDAHRRLDVVRWVQGLGAGDRCGEAEADPCQGALAAYVVLDRDPASGRPRSLRQCVPGSERVDALRYDDQGRLTGWRTLGSGPLADDDHQTAHVRQFDALHHLVRDEHVAWSEALPDLDAPGPQVADALDHAPRLSALRVVSGRSDGAPVRLVDDRMGRATELAPDPAGRATRFGAHDLTRDRQGRPARDRYDAEGRRVESPAGGERLLWGPRGLVTRADARGERTFAPPLPGLQLSRRPDGVWELALLTPTETPLVVVDPNGLQRLVALYAPTGLATEQRPVDDRAPYPKTWAGYLRHPGTGLYDAGARLYDPASGLFLEPDPVRPVPDAPETWSRYGYALGDPVGGWDPDGRCAVDFSWEYFVRVECAHVRDFFFKDLPAIDRAAGRGVVAAFDAAFDVVLTVGGALAYGVGIENDATAARAERFANGIVALAHAARNYDATFAALVHGTASGFRRYVDDLANGREERAAEAAARFAAEVELALVPTGAAARHLRNVAKARAGGVLTSVRRAAAHVSPPSPVVPRPIVARGSSWTLDERLSVDLSGFERASAAAGGGVAEPIVVLNRVDGWSRGGYGSKGGAKRGPKPFGTGPHNQKIKEVADSVTDGEIIAGGQRLPEQLIPTLGGFNSGRRPDILVRRPDGSIYGINVGKQSRRTGAPIKREAEAISDLEGAGIEMHFVPYD